MIDIVIGPNLVSLGTFILSWHGFFSFVAVASAVFLVGRWAPMKGIDPDDVYSIAIWGIIGGIIGARFVHVIDNWGFYSGNPGQIIAIWSGGIGLWGGLLGGFIGGAIYARIFKHPIGIIADLTAPALLFVQTIGRLGDFVNGEHCAKAWDFALAFVWTNPASDARVCANGVGASVHPVIAYEVIWNMISLVIIWKLRDRLKPDGMLFALYFALYSIGRFGVTFLRQDRIWAIGLQEAQFIALIVLAITVPLLLIKARPVPADEMQIEPPEPRQRGTRAERRRRERDG
ncbi:MAG: prolipoprotein diacylglyceryl transferase [SAR202 cluster bacterium]|jgi:phosphatidylglycerol:prolipoprotein diacylglycerol transferase|nr:prolipoprotein diacylglyceryl transferase [SAR202 cluster bacterium]